MSGNDEAAAAGVAPPQTLQFAPFESQIEMPFYSALFSRKLDHDKLDDSVRPVIGLYQPMSERPPAESTRMQIQGGALSSSHVPMGYTRADGSIRNFNTIEDFKKADKGAILRQAGAQIWDAIKDGSIYEIPSLLSSFAILSYADLKKYRFTYWFAYPTLHSVPAWRRDGPLARFSSKETTALVNEVGTFRYAHDTRQHGFFLAKKVPYRSGPFRRGLPRDDSDGDDIGFTWSIGALGEFEKGFFKGIKEEDQYIAFVDSSSYAENPSWPLRNLLVLIRQRFQLQKANILCYRDTQARRDEPRSIVLPLASEGPATPQTSEMPKVTGWERHPSSKLQARVISLAEYMDPTRIADQAVDLNLKLMKWRISPKLDLEAMRSLKCLLLGAGTLGSYVSRNLMGWGVRKITFVDYGNVSFSNPVRQPLFEFEDCLSGGVPKAPKAAEALKKINPGVEAEGHVLSVPMLGHPVLNEAQTKEDFEKLQQLIKAHDVVFLLMDTRESRWLPTVMGKAEGKIVMNAALGFDTYVVMRHGAAPKDGTESTLGCYFCNDVVAPSDSMKDQTLDQQCTVTRPGVAAIASAMLVEMLTSVLQHPQREHAPAPKATGPPGNPEYQRDPPDHALGIVPHQVRGFLANFQNMIISGESYPNCSACSSPIVGAYKSDGWEFVKKALSDKDYVLELSGLAEVQRQAEAMQNEVDWDEDEDVAAAEEGDGEML
ncbi:Autophagy protein 7 [Pyricularia oryzae]|uniref:Ubiquitin-like modifier-activating enzyme ATG7 n=1 Tax=Pyricularia oryzae (strain 70-15 / ATCC MYA-4617 / FGSC 8958) TaxID=242507 RepID=ATG7_PYRO7|nr:ubiquitin-like modifier-activating enzyme ATG7 [Pyricularia oryzae 70-15]Q52CS0.2 RecName: Full=Ubiquitin-like modifier-activating enzyme ATG7; AltName: Full=ATG12-activating enzyme E1 ATG7; AltName: Full=Autophagy-related protein 7 [Pyricularia oryzae 70-15]KAH9439763.1 Autophagy protein 7 [Pyricularia oryzae]EHA55718.1 ubiquitin-like modifier-activating enzyme ATG7 [Pyricularia oryzae 70-15]KAI6313842.1 Autophagy protein 7 [Pyricularia oryzae]KAI6454837.1 Autophagy protein 7 [Pyricularia 